MVLSIRKQVKHRARDGTGMTRRMSGKCPQFKPNPKRTQSVMGEASTVVPSHKVSLTETNKKFKLKNEKVPATAAITEAFQMLSAYLALNLNCDSGSDPAGHWQQKKPDGYERKKYTEHSKEYQAIGLSFNSRRLKPLYRDWWSMPAPSTSRPHPVSCSTPARTPRHLWSIPRNSLARAIRKRNKIS